MPSVLLLDEPVPYVAVAIYLSSVYGILWYARRSTKPIINAALLKRLLAVHNAVLMVASMVMSAGFGWEAYKVVSRHGWLAAYCGVDEPTDSGLYFWLNMFYLSKFYELLDTAFLVLERKQPIFLHLWHHTSVLVLVCKTIQQNVLFAWITGFNNCFVHIFMYYYYCLRSLGREVWWRKYITQMQLVQFVIDNCSSLPWLAVRLLTDRHCSGSWAGWAGGNAVGFSFFVLFLRFYASNYTNKKPSASSKRSE